MEEESRKTQRRKNEYNKKLKNLESTQKILIDSVNESLKNQKEHERQLKEIYEEELKQLQEFWNKDQEAVAKFDTELADFSTQHVTKLEQIEQSCKDHSESYEIT